jgi:hypothetical protein
VLKAAEPTAIAFTMSSIEKKYINRRKSARTTYLSLSSTITHNFEHSHLQTTSQDLLVLHSSATFSTFKMQFTIITAVLALAVSVAASPAGT